MEPIIVQFVPLTALIYVKEEIRDNEQLFHLLFLKLFCIENCVCESLCVCVCVLCADGIMIRRGLHTSDITKKIAIIMHNMIGFKLTFTQDKNRDRESILNKNL